MSTAAIGSLGKLSGDAAVQHLTDMTDDPLLGPLVAEYRAGRGRRSVPFFALADEEVRTGHIGWLRDCASQTNQWDTNLDRFCTLRGVPAALVNHVRNLKDAEYQSAGRRIRSVRTRDRYVFDQIDYFYLDLPELGIAEADVPVADALAWISVVDLAPTPSAEDSAHLYAAWRDLTDLGWVYAAAGIAAAEHQANPVDLATARTMAALRGISLPPHPALPAPQEP